MIWGVAARSWKFMENLGILAKYNMLPGIAERALAPVSPSICGICSIINSLGY